MVSINEIAEQSADENSSQGQESSDEAIPEITSEATTVVGDAKTSFA
jgi:hypothetical protein